MTPALGEAAIKLARKGLRVFPVIRADKKPAIADNLNLATVDETIIRAWWRNIDWNIGVACGPGSGIWVLDPDGPEHEAWIREREAEHGPLPPTVESITGGGGRHLYFRWPNGADIRNVQDRDDFPDVRGQGGYVLAPPSLHPSGRRYCWSVDSADKFADAPEWLIALVGNARNAANAPAATPPELWRTFVDDTFDGSHRGYAISKLAGLLLRKFLDPYVALGLCQAFNEARCVEPLEAAEVVAIVNRVARRESQRREQSGEGNGDSS